MTATSFFFLIVVLAGIGFAFIAPFLALALLVRLLLAWKRLRRTGLKPAELARHLARQIFALHPVAPAFHGISAPQK